MQYWLMKSEAECFSIDDLKNRPNQTEPWDGVRNYQARNMMRDQMQIGDLSFFYHSNAKPPGIAGIMEIVSTPYPDDTAKDPNEDHYDPKHTADNPRWCLVDVKYKRKLKRLISLPELKDNAALSSMQLLQKGNRLSILPITEQQWRLILDMI
jgi:predicted RNA-binding protein with PUA-like domain